MTSTSRPENEQSPSPPPEKPTAATPGARAAAFTTLYTQALSSTLKGISYDSFADCFPTIAKQAPDSLKFMHENFVSRLEGFAKDDFQNILIERNVVENLNKLEDLITDAKRRKARASDSSAPPIPPHTLPPTQIIQAHQTPLLASQQSQMNAKIQTIQSQNAALAETLEAQRKEMQELLGVLDRVVGDLEKAGSVLGEHGEGLATEARAAEGELKVE